MEVGPGRRMLPSSTPAAGSMGLQAWTTALLAGTLTGALWAIVHALRGRASDPFPYGPSLWLGPVVAAALVGGG